MTTMRLVTWLMISAAVLVADVTAKAPDPTSELCRERVRATIGAVTMGDWAGLERTLDAGTLRNLDSWGTNVLKLDHDGLMRFLADTAHSGRARRDIRVTPIPGSPSYFRVTETGPYTYIDDPMTADSAPCFDKAVELCVQLVPSPEGEMRLKLTYAFFDLIYLVQ